MTALVVLTVIVIALLIAGLAVYLYWTGTLLNRVAENLEECAGTVQRIVADAKLIGPGVEHINATGGVVAGALPLLYGMAEEIVAGVSYVPATAGDKAGVTARAAVVARDGDEAAVAGAAAVAGDGDEAAVAGAAAVARPASGRRRSRLHEAVGFVPQP